MAKIEFAWELGAGTGHVATLLPIAAAMKARGHDARFFLRDLSAGADLDGAAEIPREGAPIWAGPATCEAPQSRRDSAQLRLSRSVPAQGLDRCLARTPE